MTISVKRLLASAVIASAALGTGGLVRADTLSEAIALAYETNPTLQDQRAQQRVTDETYVQARAGFRPTLSLSGAAAAEDIEGAESDAGQLQLSLSVPIYTGGRVGSAVSAARAEILSGREALRQVEASVIENVIQVYVDVRRDEAALAVRQESLEALSRELEDMRTRFSVAEVTRTDVAQAEASSAQARALLASAQAQLAVTRASYTATVGRPAGPLEPEPPLPTLAATVEEALRLAETANPQLRAAIYAEQAARARVAAARAERMPAASLRVQLGHSGLLTEFEPKEVERTISATANFTQPLFAGGAINSRVRQAMARETSARVRVEGARRSLTEELFQAWSLLSAARAGIAANEEQVRAALIAFEGTKEERKVGLRTTLEVLSAQQSLSSARFALLNARRDEYMAAVALLRVMGQLEAAKLVPGVTLYDPVRAFNRHRFSGFVPWEPIVSIIDSIGVPRARILPAPQPAPPGPTPAIAP